MLSRVPLSATSWTVVCLCPVEFSRQEYWSGLPFPSPGIFLTQGSNPGLLHCRQILYHLSHQGSLLIGISFFIFPRACDLQWGKLGLPSKVVQLCTQVLRQGGIRGTGVQLVTPPPPTTFVPWLETTSFGKKGLLVIQPPRMSAFW